MSLKHIFVSAVTVQLSTNHVVAKHDCVPYKHRHPDTSNTGGTAARYSSPLTLPWKQPLFTPTPVKATTGTYSTQLHPIACNPATTYLLAERSLWNTIELRQNIHIQSNNSLITPLKLPPNTCLKLTIQGKCQQSACPCLHPTKICPLDTTRLATGLTALIASEFFNHTWLLCSKGSGSKLGRTPWTPKTHHTNSQSSFFPPMLTRQRILNLDYIHQRLA